VFEGTDGGNFGDLKAMARSTQNTNVRFLGANGANHWSVVGPVTKSIAEKIVKDSGPKCSIEFTQAEVDKLFAKK
jgi:hypothetical protein